MTQIQATSGARDIRTDFLNLLVAQLKNQDPTQPMDNQQMTTQMASLAQLEQLENQSNQLGKLQSAFDMALQTAQVRQASELIGKNVTFEAENKDGDIVERTLEVKEVEMSTGQLLLRAGDYYIGVNQLLKISD